MADYIDREKLLYGLKSLRQFKAVPPDVFYVVENMRAEDVEPVRHGNWESIGIAYLCNLCKKSFAIEQGNAEMNYCPNCGAKMGE